MYVSMYMCIIVCIYIYISPLPSTPSIPVSSRDAFNSWDSDHDGKTNTLHWHMFGNVFMFVVENFEKWTSKEFEAKTNKNQATWFIDNKQIAN